MAGLFWKMFSLSDDLARGLVLQGTELQSLMMEEIRHYYSKEVVARVKGIDGVEVAHDYQTKIHAIPLPATMTIELGKRIGERDLGLQVRLYSDYPFPWRSDGGVRDEFEADALRSMRQHPDQPYYRFEQVGSEWRLRTDTTMKQTRIYLKIKFSMNVQSSGRRHSSTWKSKNPILLGI